MPRGSRAFGQPPSRLNSRIASIQGRSKAGGSHDSTLIQARKDMNRATMRRVVENEADELLARLSAAVEDAEEARTLAVIAHWSGSEREDALRLSLQQLKAATVVWPTDER